MVVVAKCTLKIVSFILNKGENMRDVARIGSNVSGGMLPYVPGTMISSQQHRVFVHNVPVCVVGDRASNSGKLVTGSSKVFIDGIPVSRVGDNLNYGGVVLDGDPIMKIE